jgi:outer membrane protein assembly factor BamD (BamD/ComL family)
VTDVAAQKIDEDHEKTKSVKELMDEGNADLAMGKYSSACELFSLAVEKL